MMCPHCIPKLGSTFFQTYEDALVSLMTRVLS